MLSHTRQSRPLPLSQFSVTPNAEQKREDPRYLGHLTAEFSDVQALDTVWNEQVTVDYFVEGRLSCAGERLVMDELRVVPLDGDGVPYDYDYRYRPGLGNTVGMAQAIAGRLHAEYPFARTLDLAGHRVTDGFSGKKDQRVSVSLG